MKNKQGILLFLLFVVFFFQNQQSFAQSVSLSNTRLTLKTAFTEIEKQTKMSVDYNREVIDVNKTVSIQTKNGSLADIMTALLQGTGCVYTIKENHIVISTASATQQSSRKNIAGVVFDERGDPLIGVNVVEKGTTNGVVTDIDGKFNLSVSENAILQVSYIGYTNQEVRVSNQTSLQIVLNEDLQTLEEVVVIGYGTVKKRDLTGSVISVSASKLKERSYSNAMQSLAGQLPGVQIIQSQGSPGLAPTIKVRGPSSINSGTSPLYVIDGMPLEDGTSSVAVNNLNSNSNPLHSINPQDIESIEILKDASSAAIYGSRGANGVVLITTKQGKAGSSRVELNYECGVSNVARRYELMNAPEFIQYTIDARNNSWVTRNPGTNSASDPNSVRPINYQIPTEFSDPEWLARIGNGTDWQDVLFRTGITQNVQASVSGGSERTQFMFSAGYLNTKGVVDNDDYERITARSNIRHQLSKHFNTGMNLSFARINESPYGTEGKADAVSLSIQNGPIFPVYNENGNLGFRDPNSIWNTFEKYGYNLWHPYAITRETSRKRNHNNFLGNAFLEWNIIEGLMFKTSLSATINHSEFNEFRNEGQKWGWSAWQPAEARHNAYTLFNWVFENTLNYSKTFGDHAITGLLGFTAQEQKEDFTNLTSQGFPNDMVHTLNAGTPTGGGTSATEWALMSYLARATYGYKDKYLLSAAIRADGCSRFGADNRWGYFPSASAGWRLSEEDFLQGTDWLANMKLRLSYGVTGNNSIGNYSAIGTLSTNKYAFNNNVYPGLYIDKFADSKLKWEKTHQFNVGLDVGLWNNRLMLVYDFYHSKTVDLLLNVPIPVLTGFTSTLTNIGQLQNRGMELNITSKNLTGDFEWVTDFNISGNRNKVLKLGQNNAPIDVTDNSAISRTEVGQPIGNFFGYIFDGVIMNEAELSQYPCPSNSEPGDPRVRDVNGDGKITPEDRTTLGNAQPDFIWGLTNTFTYKGFDLSIMLQGVQGAEIFNQEARFTKIFSGNRNAYDFVSNYWKSESNPGNGKIFKPRVDQNTLQAQSSSYWVEDGSFIRIRNLRLGYRIPQQLVRKLSASSMKVYVNVENLYTFSDYPNYDPEASSFQRGTLIGFDYGTYPNPRTITFGLNVSF